MEILKPHSEKPEHLLAEAPRLNADLTSIVRRLVTRFRAATGRILIASLTLLGTGVCAHAELQRTEVEWDKKNTQVTQQAIDLGLSSTAAKSQILASSHTSRLLDRLDTAIASRSEHDLLSLLHMDIGDENKRRAFVVLEEIYRNQESPSRLISLYERFISELPRDAMVPQLSLNLGRLYRDAGAMHTALDRFYSVLNVALNVSVADLHTYQEISQQAQMEIARTLFSMGSYEQSARIFQRLLRLDLSDDDRRRVAFKHAYTAFLAGKTHQSADILRNFVSQYPSSVEAAEIRYLLSEIYLYLSDTNAALRETLELLSVEVSKSDSNPEAWLFWKKRTGNRFANQIYQHGNFLDALRVYEAMLNLSRAPSWRLPILYQMGLCYEKLEMKPKAMEQYAQMMEMEARFPEALIADLTLASIVEMAAWRHSRIKVSLDLDAELSALVNRS